MRTSGPAFPSGRRAASTGQIVPSRVCSEHTCIRCPASWAATRAAAASSASSGGLEDVDDVHVGDVVELVSPALAHRDHGKAGARGRLAHAGAGHGEGRLERPGREVGELRRDIVDALVVREVAGREAQQDAAVLHAQCVHRLGVRERRDRCRVARVGADRTEQLGADREGRRPGGAERRVGELLPLLGVADQVVGQAVLAPSTDSSRIAVPSSSATADSNASPSSAASASRTRPSRAWSGSPVRARTASSGSAASPSRSRLASERSASTKPIRTRLPLLVVLLVHRCAPTTRDETGGQRAPGLVELGAGRVDPGQYGGLVDPALEVVVAVAGGPRPHHGLVRLGVQLDPPHRRREPGDLQLTLGGGGQSTTAPSGRAVTRSVFHWIPRMVGGRPETRSSSFASGRHPTSYRPTCWPRGLTSTVPPRATATSWWPRQTPRVGTPVSTASRTRSLTVVSQGWVASSWALIEPPRITKAS